MECIGTLLNMEGSMKTTKQGNDGVVAVDQVAHGRIEEIWSLSDACGCTAGDKMVW